MSAKTPRFQIEYAVPSDKVADVAAITQRAATRVEEILTRVIGSRQQGRVNLGAYQPGETYEASVNFPRAFKKPPNIAVSCSNQRIRLAIYEVTTTGFKYFGWNDTSDANSSDAYFDYIASCDDITD